MKKSGKVKHSNNKGLSDKTIIRVFVFLFVVQVAILIKELIGFIF